MRLYDLTINEYVDKFGKMTERYFVQYMQDKGHNVDWVEKMRWTNYNAMFNKLVDAGKIKGQEANSRYWIRAFRADVANVGKFISMVQNDGTLTESINLNEKLLEIDDDVDRIYDKYFKDIIDKINNKEYENRKQFLNHIERMKDKVTLDTLIKEGIIQSPEMITLNEKHKGVMFTFNHRDKGGFYNPSKRTVDVSIDKMFARVLINSDYNIDNIVELTGNLESKSYLENMLTAKRIKGTIHHEIAHLYDDVNHHKHIGKWLSDRAINKHDEIDQPLNLSSFEIEGIIHTISQFKKDMDNWDSLTFDEVISQVPSLMGIKDEYKNKQSSWKKWKKLVLKRMAREGLLGDNMR